MKKLFDLFKKGNKANNDEKEVQATVNTDFVKGISLDENPFENETPDDVKVYDLDGNEVRD